jgi:hypothetical protein
MNLREAWNSIEIRPWRLVVLLLGFSIVLGLARVLFPCGVGEKMALGEFPHYGGREAGEELGVAGDEVVFPPLQTPPPGCFLEFAAPRATPEQVSTYYEQELTEHGWTVKRVPVDREGEFEYPHLEGTRNGFRYVVHYWPSSLTSTAPAAWSSALDEGGTEIRVLVYKP